VGSPGRPVSLVQTEPTPNDARALIGLPRGRHGRLGRMASIVWWEIETPDPETFQGFHNTLWGWTFRPAFADSALGADYWIITLDATGIGGLQRAATRQRPHPGARVYLEVTDLERTLLQVEELGGLVERPRTALGADDRWFATFRDPAGVSIGLWTSSDVGAA
jgi:predicted enzyme related to lactoylglutathione lyase